MLTLRDASGTRMLTEAVLLEEIRSGEVTGEAEVRLRGGFTVLEDDGVFSRVLEEPRSVLARRLHDPPLPLLAGLAIGLSLFKLLQQFPDLGSEDTASWLLLTLPAAGIVALNERAFGTVTLLIPAVITILAVAIWVFLGPGHTDSLHLLLPLVLIGSGLGASLRNRPWVPLSKRRLYGPWQVLALIPAVEMMASSGDWGALIIGGIAGVLARLMPATALHPKWFMRSLLLAAGLLIPAGFLSALGSPLLLLLFGATQPLSPAGVSLWLPAKSEIQEISENGHAHPWDRMWKIDPSIGPPVLVALSGDLHSGFSTELMPAAGMLINAHPILWGARHEPAYTVAGTCAEVADIDCARAHYLAGDLDTAHRIATRREGQRPEHIAARALLARIWQTHPDLSPAAVPQKRIDWLIDAATYASADPDLLATIADSITPTHCARAQHAAQAPSLTGYTHDRLDAVMLTRCEGWR